MRQIYNPSPLPTHSTTTPKKKEKKRKKKNKLINKTPKALVSFCLISWQKWMTVLSSHSQWITNLDEPHYYPYWEGKHSIKQLTESEWQFCPVTVSESRTIMNHTVTLAKKANTNWKWTTIQSSHSLWIMNHDEPQCYPYCESKHSIKQVCSQLDSSHTCREESINCCSIQNKDTTTDKHKLYAEQLKTYTKGAAVKTRIQNSLNILSEWKTTRP